MKQTEDTGERKTKLHDAMTAQIVASAIAIIIGLLLLFVPQTEVQTLCGIACISLMITGVAAMISFFLSEAYKKLHNYNFALGVLLLIIGCTGLVRVAELSQRFDLYIGFSALIIAVIILQSMVQMAVLNNKLWIAELVLTVISLFGAVVLLADIQPIISRIPEFSYWVLTLAGVFSLISLLLACIGLRIENKSTDTVWQEDRLDDVND